MNFSKRILIILCFIFLVDFLYAFEPRQYIIDELKNIAENQRHEYYFYAGKQWESYGVSEEVLVHNLLKYCMDRIQDAPLGDLPAPKSVAESKMYAQALWDFYLYVFMKWDLIVREKR